MIKLRYEYCSETNMIIDNELDNYVDNVIERLNTQDLNKKDLLKKYHFLEDKIRVLKKSLELACDYLVSNEGDELFEICKDIYDDKEYLKAKRNYFINKAREILKGE